MFTYIIKLFQRPKGTGANLDNRPKDKQDKDYHLSELVGAVNPVTWIEKPQSGWRKFPIFNQNGSGSCVAQTLAKLMGISYWLLNGIYVHFSATHIYQRRPNKPAGGMAGVDAFNIAREGVTLENLAPSQNLTDEQMDSYKVTKEKEEVGKVFAISNFIVDPINDIDTIASIIQTTGKGVMVWFYFKYAEWNDMPTVQGSMDLYASSTIRHSVTAVDFTLYKGKKAIIIEDSWGPTFGLGGQRIITEDFFRDRNFFAGHIMKFVFEDETQNPDTNKPKYKFTKQLSFIPWDVSKNQPANMSAHTAQKADVIALQNILKYEGLFPKNVDSTGYYGAVTAKHVKEFQIKYNLAPIEELNQLQGRTVGPKTIEKLNSLYK